MPQQRAARSKHGDHEAGQASFELIGYVFIVMLVAVMCLQAVYISQAAGVAQQAARDGARACAQGQSVQAAVERQLPSWAVLQTTPTCPPGADADVAVTIRVPLMVGHRTVDWLTVTRSAVMPRT